MERPGSTPGRHLVLALTSLGLLAFLFPLVELLLAITPFQFDSTQWRFGSEGLLSAATINMTIGLMFLLAGAVLSGSDRRLAVVGWISILMPVLILAALAMFALDTIQIGSMVRPEAKNGIKRAAISGMLRGIFASVVMVTFFIAARKTRRELIGRPRTAAEAGGLIPRSTPMAPPPPAGAPAKAPIVD